MNNTKDSLIHLLESQINVSLDIFKTNQQYRIATYNSISVADYWFLMKALLNE